MKGLVIVVLLTLAVSYIHACPTERPPACGGSCISSSQCVSWAHNSDCRCLNFICVFSRNGNDIMTTVIDKFSALIKEYSGYPETIAPTEISFQRNK